MGWERRGNGRYYYIGRRVAERVEKEYIGKGTVATLVVEAQALAKLEQTALHALEMRERVRLKKYDAMIEKACSEIELLFKATLFADGCYRTKAWQWRRKREKSGSRTIK